MSETRGAYVLVPAEVAKGLPIPSHLLSRDEWRAEAICDAPDGSVCRLLCAEDCGAESWPCGGYDYENDEEREPHPMRDGGYCNAVLFLNGNGDATECAVDQDDPTARTYTGRINVSWSGADETYLWEPVTSA